MLQQRPIGAEPSQIPIRPYLPSLGRPTGPATPSLSSGAAAVPQTSLGSGRDSSVERTLLPTLHGGFPAASWRLPGSFLEASGPVTASGSTSSFKCHGGALSISLLQVVAAGWDSRRLRQHPADGASGDSSGAWRNGGTPSGWIRKRIRWWIRKWIRRFRPCPHCSCRSIITSYRCSSVVRGWCQHSR